MKKLSYHLTMLFLSLLPEKVIGKISEQQASHVPYLDYKLTRLLQLQSSLSGHGYVSLCMEKNQSYLLLKTIVSVCCCSILLLSDDLLGVGCCCILLPMKFQERNVH